MTVARTILMLIVAAGGLPIAACAPPTPKVAVSIVPQVNEIVRPVPHNSLDRSGR